jgi:hypothetical protein
VVGYTQSFPVWCPNVLDQKGLFSDCALPCVCPLWHQLYPLLDWIPASVFCMDTQKCRSHMSHHQAIPISEQWTTQMDAFSHQSALPVPGWVRKISKQWLCFNQMSLNLGTYKAVIPKQPAQSWVRKGSSYSVYPSHSYLHPSIPSSYSPTVGLSHLRRQTEVHQM